MSKSTHNRKKSLGDASGPRSARVPSPKKATPSGRSDRYRAPARATCDARYKDLCKALVMIKSRVTALESRLPVAPAPAEDQKIEPWVPKVGDWIMPKISHAKNGRMLEAHIYEVRQMDDPMDADNCVCLGENRWITLADCRPATPEEITTYKEEQQRKEEARLQAEREAQEAANKPLEFGQVVLLDDNVHRQDASLNGLEWRVACPWPNSVNQFGLVAQWLGIPRYIHLKRSEFTITSPT